jgi:hypothetical protein
MEPDQLPDSSVSKLTQQERSRIDREIDSSDGIVVQNINHFKCYYHYST